MTSLNFLDVNEPDNTNSRLKFLFFFNLINKFDNSIIPLANNYEQSHVDKYHKPLEDETVLLHTAIPSQLDDRTLLDRTILPDGFKNKYIKYKNKYIVLKEKLINY